MTSEPAKPTEAWVEAQGAKYAYAYDKGGLMGKVGASGYPSAVLVNASGVVVLDERELATNFVRYLLTREVQGYLAREAYEIPLVDGVAPPPGLPALDTVSPPQVDLTKLADLRPTLDLMRDAGVL